MLKQFGAVSKQGLSMASLIEDVPTDVLGGTLSPDPLVAIDREIYLRRISFGVGDRKLTWRVAQTIPWYFSFVRCPRMGRLKNKLLVYFIRKLEALIDYLDF